MRVQTPNLGNNWEEEIYQSENVEVRRSKREDTTQKVDISILNQPLVFIRTFITAVILILYFQSLKYKLKRERRGEIKHAG